MDFIFIPHGRYLKIIEILKKWKLLDANGLQDLLGDISRPNLYKKMRYLERHGIVESCFTGGSEKCFFLTEYQSKNGRRGKNRFKKNLKHDLLTAKVLREFLKWPEVQRGEILGQAEGDYVCPDAEFCIENAGKEIRVALEIELTRKSSYRVRRKFAKYQTEREFERVLFVTNDVGIFKSYGNYLAKLPPEIQEKIGLLFDGGLSLKSFDWQNSLCFYMGETSNFSSLFFGKNSGEKLKAS